MGRNGDLCACKLPKGSHNTLVACHATLEKDLLAYGSSVHHAVEIVLSDRVCQASGQVFHCRSLLLAMNQVRFHKDCASFPQAGRSL